MGGDSEPLRSILKRAREEAGLSRTELADRLGVSRGQIYKIEDGTRSTTIERARDWLAACGFAVREIALSDSDQVGAILSALGALDHQDRADVARIVARWSLLPGHLKRAVLELIDPYRPPGVGNCSEE